MLVVSLVLVLGCFVGTISLIVLSMDLDQVWKFQVLWNNFSFSTVYPSNGLYSIGLSRHDRY